MVRWVRMMMRNPCFKSNLKYVKTSLKMNQLKGHNNLPKVRPKLHPHTLPQIRTKRLMWQPPRQWQLLSSYAMECRQQPAQVSRTLNQQRKHSHLLVSTVDSMAVWQQTRWQRLRRLSRKQIHFRIKYRQWSATNLQPPKALDLRGSPLVEQRVELISRIQLISRVVLEEGLTGIEVPRDRLKVDSQIQRRKEDLQHFKIHWV